MMPRANHSATYVPPSIAGDSYPDGYLLVFGGCVNGASSNAMSLLDFSNYQWTEFDTRTVAAMPFSPEPQNSHSATLLCNKRMEHRILFLGGGSGDDRNGGPPRGGRDFASEYWLRGLEGAQFRWERSGGHGGGLGGRGHVAVKLCTDTVVMLGGGKPPLQRASAINCEAQGPQDPQAASENSRLLESKTKGPAARAFGGGCTLPDGLAMVYGGWHPCKGTFGDVWVACFDDIGRNSAFFQQLPVRTEVEEPDVEEPTDESDDMAFNLVIQRLFGQMEGHRMQRMRDDGDDSDSEEEEDDDCDEQDENDSEDRDVPPEETVENCSGDLLLIVAGTSI